MVEGNRIIYSWSENPLLDEDGLWIEYQDLVLQGPMSMEYLAPYLTLCLAFAVLGKVSVHLPYKIPEEIFLMWIKTIEDTALAVYKREKGFRLINGSKSLKETVWEGDKTALLFGGGSEALLTLGHLSEENVKPIIMSFGGSGWYGSDPEVNPHKFEMDSKISKKFGLKIFKIKSSFFELMYEPDGDWSEYLKNRNTGMIRASLFLPFMVSAVLPVANQLNILRVVSGNEKENSLDPILYCFSRKSANNLRALSNSVYYESCLEDLQKHEVVRNLHLKFPQFAKYQYSCLMNRNKRWCLQCEKCFRVLVFIKIHGIPLSRVGVSEKEFIHNLKFMIARASEELIKYSGRKKEYWLALEEARKINSKESICLLKKALNRSLILKIWHKIGPRIPFRAKAFLKNALSKY